MKYRVFKKKDISEVVNSYGELIGKEDIPQGGADLESQASNTTDNNVSISAQPFRYDMLGRFGFTMLPFFESEKEPNIDDSNIQILDDLAKIMYDRHIETLEYYFRNPNKLKSDFRLYSELDFDSQPQEKKEIDYEWAKKIIALCDTYISNANTSKDDDTTQKNKIITDDSDLKEGIVQEKVLNSKDEDELSKKTNNNDMREKKLEKIAGLVNKLDKRDVDKLINLLERK